MERIQKVAIFGILSILTTSILVLLILNDNDSLINKFSLGESRQQQLQELKGVLTPQDVLVEDNQIFVSNRGSGIIRIYDTEVNKITKNISSSSIDDDLFTPGLLSLDSNRGILYVTNDAIFPSDDDIMLAGIELRSNRLIANFSAQALRFNSTSSFHVEDMTFDRAKDTLYLTSEEGLVAIDGKTQNIRHTKFTGHTETEEVTPSQIKVNPKTNFLYLINNNTVSVFDGDRNEMVIPSIKVASYPANIALDSDSNLIYIINRDANRLSLINGTTHNLEGIFILNTNSSALSDDNRRINPDILVNPNLNKIYISNSDANSVIVVDANTKKVIKTIPTDRPEKLAIDQKKNLVYVMNGLSDSISVIDGNKDVLVMGRTPYLKEAGIKIPDGSESIAVNTRTNTVYIGGSGSVSVIDGRDDKLLTTISLRDDPVDLVVNELSNKVYSSNCLDNSISIIDGDTNKIINESIPIAESLSCPIVADKHSDNVYFLSSNSSNARLNVLNSTGHLDSIDIPYLGMDFDLGLSSSIYIASGLFEDYVYAIDPSSHQWESIEVGEYPRKVITNPNTALVYAVNQNSHTVSVIDEYSHDVIKEIQVGTFPSDIALNNKTNMLYVTNEHSDTVSVIDGTTNNVVDTIPVGNFPVAVAVNPATNLVYVNNDDSETISVVDGNTREGMVGINFNINPTNSGQLICNGEKIVNASYIRYNIGTALECKAIPNKGFVIGLWSGNVIPDSKDVSSDTLLFEISRFGDLSVNFEESSSVDLNIPFDTLVQIMLIVLTAIIGWLIPGILGFSSKLRQKKKIVTYMKSINSANNEDILEELRKEISNDYAKGKLDSTNYEILNNRIKEEKEILHHTKTE